MTAMERISLSMWARAGREQGRSCGGGGRIRTYEGVSRQIYSLLPLAAWVPLREKRAAYSDFRPGTCQCSFRAKWPYLFFFASAGHADAPNWPRVPYQPVLIECSPREGHFSPLRCLPTAPVTGA